MSKADDAAAAPSVASQVGNAAIARVLQARGADGTGDGPQKLDHEIARAIEQQRGGGHELDTGARAKLEGALDHDFSDVRIHDDSTAHDLSQSISAEAFTTGSDVFFQSGKYDSSSGEGQKLLAHELTHVVQQRGSSPTSEMTVSDPGDASELEAAAVADRVSSASVSAATTPAAGTVSRSGDEEEVQMSRVDRAEEEEQVQMSRVDRAAEEEEQAPQA